MAAADEAVQAEVTHQAIEEVLLAFRNADQSIASLARVYLGVLYMDQQGYEPTMSSLMVLGLADEHRKSASVQLLHETGCVEFVPIEDSGLGKQTLTPLGARVFTELAYF